MHLRDTSSLPFDISCPPLLSDVSYSCVKMQFYIKNRPFCPRLAGESVCVFSFSLLYLQYISMTVNKK